MVGDMVMSATGPSPRSNPGPVWGYRFLLGFERWSPSWFFRPVLMAGTWVGLAFMPAQRSASRTYLTVVLGRAPRWVEVWEHFYAFADFLMLKLRAGRGVKLTCTLEPENRTEFVALAESDRPALFGTFHFGWSDLLGYLLSDWDRRVSVLRTRVGNSDDTRLLGERFGVKGVTFLWVNDPANFLFELKDAVQSGASLALKCDRLDFSARTEIFEFLGARRVFPFTIYFLAVLFDLPAVFCLGLPGAEPDTLSVIASPVFTPNPRISRKENLAAAHVHFQGVLRQLEAVLRRHPELWFNFLPLNPVAPDPVA
jgi:predicted LPLAT superfamily acyltransferase